jgi:UDP-glucuronate decarboxylase
MNSDNSTIGPINLGNPNEIEVIKIAEKIIELTNSSSKIVFRPLPLDDPMQRKPDIARAKELLRWEPKIDLETGLNETISYFKNLV